MRRNVIETIMGAVVLVVAAFFVYFAFTSADLGGVQGYEVTANFTNADGLKPGTEVRLSGIKVGTVDGQLLDPATYIATITITIDEAVKIPEDSTARVLSDGLLGDNYIMIEPGASDAMIEAGGQIRYTQDAINVVDLIGRFMFSGPDGEQQ